MAKLWDFSNGWLALYLEGDARGPEAHLNIDIKILLELWIFRYVQTFHITIWDPREQLDDRHTVVGILELNSKGSCHCCPLNIIDECTHPCPFA